jgi:hypothetical protein
MSSEHQLPALVPADAEMKKREHKTLKTPDFLWSVGVVLLQDKFEILTKVFVDGDAVSEHCRRSTIRTGSIHPGLLPIVVDKERNKLADDKKIDLSDLTLDLVAAVAITSLQHSIDEWNMNFSSCDEDQAS